MMNRKVYKIVSVHGFESDYDYWNNQRPIDRMRALEILRQRYLNLFYEGSGQGLQRIYRFVKRKRR